MRAADHIPPWIAQASIAVFLLALGGDGEAGMVEKWEVQRVRLGDGAQLSALVQPRGKGPTLVLVHGSFGDAHAFDRLIPRLDPGLGLRLVLPILRGRGESWPPAAVGSGIELFTDDVRQTLDALGIDSFYIGGHSLGGMVALDMLRVCPDRVRGVLAMEGWTHHTVPGGAFGGNVYGTLGDAQRAEVERQRAEISSRWTPEQRKDYPLIWTRWEHGREILARTDRPVLELWGDRGRPRPSLAQLQVPGRANIEVSWLQNVSHAFMDEAPEETARVLGDFIRRVEAVLEQRAR